MPAPTSSSGAALGCRYTRHGKRAELLALLGDVCLVQGLLRPAWRAYAAASRERAAGAALRARCWRRLARVALARRRVQAARHLLTRALPALPAEERAVALCDLALAETLDGDPRAGLRTLAQAARAADRPAVRCARSLVLTGDPLLDLAELVETTALLTRTTLGRVDTALADEAERAAQALGSATARAQPIVEDDWWSPIHPSA